MKRTRPRPKIVLYSKGSMAGVLFADGMKRVIDGRPKALLDDLGAATLSLPDAVIEHAGALINQRTVLGPRYNPQSSSEVDTETFGT